MFCMISVKIYRIAYIQNGLGPLGGECFFQNEVFSTPSEDKRVEDVSQITGTSHK